MDIILGKWQGRLVTHKNKCSVLSILYNMLCVCVTCVGIFNELIILKFKSTSILNFEGGVHQKIRFK